MFFNIGVILEYIYIYIFRNLFKILFIKMFKICKKEVNIYSVKKFK